MTTLTDRERIARIIEHQEWQAFDVFGHHSDRNSRLIERSKFAADRLLAAGLQFKD